MAGFGPGRTHGSATLGRQMLVGEPNSGLVHFDIDAGVNISAETGVDGAIDKMYEEMATKGTPVIMGTLQADNQSIRVAFETGAAGWTAASLQAALRALGDDVGPNSIDLTGAAVADFTY